MYTVQYGRKEHIVRNWHTTHDLSARLAVLAHCAKHKLASLVGNDWGRTRRQT